MIGDRDCIDVSMRTTEELDRMRCFLASPSTIAAIDVETTGLKPGSDEILQVAICDGNGKELLNSYVMPERRRRWPNAQKVNGITWDMVRDAPTLAELATEIQSILQSTPLVIGYNLRFDFSMLEAGGVDIQTGGYTWDIMNDCSVMIGAWNASMGKYAYVRLQAIARHYGISYKPHDALEDARATSRVFYRLLNDPKYTDKVIEKEAFLGDEVKREEQRRKEQLDRISSIIERYGYYDPLAIYEDKRSGKDQEKRLMPTWKIVMISILAGILLCTAMFSCTPSCSHTRRRSRSTMTIQQIE